MTLGTWSCQHKPRTFMITITITYSCKARNTKFTEAQRHIRATITSERPSHHSAYHIRATFPIRATISSEQAPHQSVSVLTQFCEQHAHDSGCLLRVLSTKLSYFSLTTTTPLTPLRRTWSISCTDVRNHISCTTGTRRHLCLQGSPYSFSQGP